MDSTPSDLIVMRSPFNGEVIKFAPESLAPGQLNALLQAKFEYVNPPKGTSKSKEKRHGTSEADGD